MTEQSNHALNESLSALVDGEASPLEVRRLLKAGAEDPALRAQWSRYQLTAAVMKRELGSMAPAGFADRISAALEDEAAPAGHRRHWWQRAGQAAVAASVAGAVLIGVQQFPGGAPTATEVVADTTPAAETNDVGRAQPVSLPAGYQLPNMPSARTASAESGYEPLQRPSREVIFVPVRAESGEIPAEEIRAYLNHLMQVHTGHAARNSNQGVLPYARVSGEEE